MPHIVLLGDSIFDNAPYTGGKPDVVSHLRAALPPDWQATLLAVDGSTTREVSGQLRRVPSDATHLVLSVGGNDALPELDFLDKAITSTAEALRGLADIQDRFEKQYVGAVDSCLRTGLPLTICTIYECDFPDQDFHRRVRIALSIFNDLILRVAAQRHLDVIELRAVCHEAEDFVYQIEPSTVGGEKIARAILRAVDDKAALRWARIGV